MSTVGRAYISVIGIAGIACFVNALRYWDSADSFRFTAYLVTAVLAAGMKIHLPAVTGTMSVNFLFVLIGIIELSLGETMLIGTTAILAQCLWKPKKRTTWVQLLFNFGCSSIAIYLTWLAYITPPLLGIPAGPYLRLAFAACVFFVANTLPVAAVISLTEQRDIPSTWRTCYFWSFPYYLVGASLAALFSALNRGVGWQTSLLALPVVYVVFHSYRLYLGKLENEKTHALEVAQLHLRTIEALALAIEAKDDTTHGHLQRVNIYATEIARELQLPHHEIEALRAASLLHDIGKLAVPEHIISKPGKLTPEEFEKMKIHPLIGAEILERVDFPYPVVPIVRAHHERWDGSGYPFGLSGEDIPIGARILAAVDCLDALASDRQYRRALPLDEAIKVVESEAGKSFDPRIVGILSRRYIELENLARSAPTGSHKLSTNLKVTNGKAPAAGFERSDPAAAPGAAVAPAADFLASIAAARQEVQSLFELAQHLGNSLSLSETLTVFSRRLAAMIPHQTMVIYVERGGSLHAEYVTGEDSGLFLALQIPRGEGLAGWVAENRKPIINGNPSVEPGYQHQGRAFTRLRSALSIPLDGLNGPLGVLALYHIDKDAFTRDHLRILLAIASKLSLAIENALRFQQVESSATTDFLTGLPNARSLFLQLDAELNRSRRQGIGLSVLVCDLDGFKAVNDRFGHLSGNRLLQLFSARLRELCRDYDYVARMGGDEFVVLIQGIATPDLAAKIDQFKRAALDASLAVTGEPIVTLSLGHAHFPHDGATAEALLAEADKRMYKAKQDSRRTPRTLHVA